MTFENSEQERDIIDHWNKTVVPLTRKITRDLKNTALFKPPLITNVIDYFKLVSDVLNTLAESVKSHDDKYFVINFLEQLKSETIKDFDKMEKLCAKYYPDAIPTIDNCRFKLSTRASDHALRSI